MLALMMAMDTEEDRISFKKLYEKTYRKFMDTKEIIAVGAVKKWILYYIVYV